MNIILIIKMLVTSCLLLSNYKSNINWLYEFSFVFNTEDYWNVLFAHLYFAVQLYVPLKRKPKPRFRDFKKKCTVKTSETYLTRKPYVEKIAS